MSPLIFPFRCIVHANDRTIEEYIKIANHVGIEGVNWKYEWADGGRAVFSSDTEQAIQIYRVDFRLTARLAPVSRKAIVPCDEARRIAANIAKLPGLLRKA